MPLGLPGERNENQRSTSTRPPTPFLFQEHHVDSRSLEHEHTPYRLNSLLPFTGAPHVLGLKYSSQSMLTAKLCRMATVIPIFKRGNRWPQVKAIRLEYTTDLESEGGPQPDGREPTLTDTCSVLPSEASDLGRQGPGQAQTKPAEPPASGRKAHI